MSNDGYEFRICDRERYVRQRLDRPILTRIDLAEVADIDCAALLARDRWLHDDRRAIRARVERCLLGKKLRREPVGIYVVRGNSRDVEILCDEVPGRCNIVNRNPPGASSFRHRCSPCRRAWRDESGDA